MTPPSEAIDDFLAGVEAYHGRLSDAARSELAGLIHAQFAALSLDGWAPSVYRAPPEALEDIQAGIRAVFEAARILRSAGDDALAGRVEEHAGGMLLRLEEGAERRTRGPDPTLEIGLRYVVTLCRHAEIPLQGSRGMSQPPRRLACELVSALFESKGLGAPPVSKLQAESAPPKLKARWK